MKRWPVITGLGLTAVPAGVLTSALFVAIVESWKAGYLTKSCKQAVIIELSPGSPERHCLIPVTVLSADNVWPHLAIVLVVAGLWWTGWFWLQASQRKSAFGTATQQPLPASNLVLLLLFSAALALGAYLSQLNADAPF